MTATRVAVAGFGTAGEARLAAYGALAAADLVAVADPSPDRQASARALDPDLHVYATLTELLAAEPAVRVVDVCSPPAFHLPLSTEAMTAGRHVICEKPVAFRTADATALLATSKRTGRLLYPSHNYGFSPTMRVLRAAVDDGTVTAPLSAAFHIERDTHARGVGSWQPDWRRDAAVAGGGILLDHGTHCVYMATRLFGAVPTKVACTLRWGAQEGIDEGVRLELQFPAGTAEVDLSWTSAARTNRYLVAGPAGRVDVRGAVAHVTRDGRTEERAVGSPTRNGTHEEWFGELYADFADLVDHPEQWERPAAEILSTARFVEAAYRSAALDGQPVELAAA